MEINSEPLMGSITLMNDPEVTNNLIINNSIERQIIVDGKIYFLGGILQIPSNMSGGQVTKDINGTFRKAIKFAITALSYNGVNASAPATNHLTLIQDLEENNFTRTLENALNTHTFPEGRAIVRIVHRDQESYINFFFDNNLLARYNRLIGQQQISWRNVVTAHLSAHDLIIDPDDKKKQNPPNPNPNPRHYSPGVFHLKLEPLVGGSKGQDQENTVGYHWRLNYVQPPPEGRFYLSVRHVVNNVNQELANSEPTQIILGAINTFLSTIDIPLNLLQTELQTEQGQGRLQEIPRTLQNEFRNPGAAAARAAAAAAAAPRGRRGRRPSRAAAAAALAGAALAGEPAPAPALAPAPEPAPGPAAPAPAALRGRRQKGPGGAATGGLAGGKLLKKRTKKTKKSKKSKKTRKHRRR